MSRNVVRQPGESETLNVVGDRIRILADSSTTDGKCCMFEDVTAPGKGPPLHRHGRDDEILFVAEGTVKFVVDGQESIVPAGGCVFAARGSVHTFVNVGTSPSKLIITCCPGGIEGPFREADRLEREGHCTLDALIAAFRKFDLEFVGLPLRP